MPNWRLMIEIIWHSNADFYTYKNNNRAFKCQFVAIYNVRLRSIWGYNIDKARYWWIYNKFRFKDISNSQNHTWWTNYFRHRPIQMHRQHTGMYRRSQERTLNIYNVRQSTLWNTNKHTNYYTLTLWCCCCCYSIFLCCYCGYLLNKNSTPKFIIQN